MPANAQIYPQHDLCCPLDDFTCMFDLYPKRSLYFCLLVFFHPTNPDPSPVFTHLSNILTIHPLGSSSEKPGMHPRFPSRSFSHSSEVLSFLPPKYLQNSSISLQFCYHLSPGTTVSCLSCSSLQLVCLPPRSPSSLLPTYTLQPQQSFKIIS